MSGRKGIKGVVLAGGLGTRLDPLTRVTNKHLLPVYNKPMVIHPLEKLVQADVLEVMLVTGGPHAGDFLRLLGNGRKLGLRDLAYTYQEGEGGIAEALKLTEEFAAGSRVCVILGDNIFSAELGPTVDRFLKQPEGARILLKEVSNPDRFGVATIEGERVSGIVEKPSSPESPLAVTGIYLYDEEVYRILPGLKPSGRGELEITDVNNDYIRRGVMTHEILEGWWSDAGTFESLLQASRLAAGDASGA